MSHCRLWLWMTGTRGAILEPDPGTRGPPFASVFCAELGHPVAWPRSPGDRPEARAVTPEWSSALTLASRVSGWLGAGHKWRQQVWICLALGELIAHCPMY